MHTLNVKRTVIVLATVVIVAGSTHLLHSYQLQWHSPTFKAKAEAAWNDNPKRVKDALQSMKEYLALQPDDLEALEEMGTWNLECGRFSPASAILEETLRKLEKQTPPSAETMQRVRWKLVKAAQFRGDLTQAIYYLQQLKRDQRKNVEILKLLGQCLVSVGREEGKDGALEIFSQAIERAPDRVDIYYCKAKTLISLQKIRAAEDCMTEMIKAPVNDKSAGAHLSYGLWLSELGDNQRALEHALRAADLAKDHQDEINRGAVHLAGKSELAMRHFVDAEKYARQGLAAAPQDCEMHVLMADILVRSDRLNDAIALLKKSVDTVSSNAKKAELLWHLANLYLDRYEGLQGPARHESIAAAQGCMEKMRNYGYQAANLSFLEARVLYANEDWKSAREHFEQIRPNLDDPHLLKCLNYWVGFCYLQQGNPDQANVAFNNALSFDATDFLAHDGIAKIYHDDGRLKDAALEYQKAAKLNPTDPQAWLAYANALVHWALQSPGEQDWEQVLNDLQRAENINPHNPLVKLLRAELLAARGGAPGVKVADEMVSQLQLSPREPGYWIAKANLAARQGHEAKGSQILQDATTELGDRVALRLARAGLLMRAAGSPGADIEQLADHAEHFSPDDRYALWNGLLGPLTEIREYERAKRVCQRIAALRPRDAMIRYRLLELALLTHDARNPAASLAEVDQVLEEIDKWAGRGPLWMYGKAVRLKLEADAGNPKLLDEALHYAVRAQNMRLRWSRPHILQGEIYREQGKNEDALAQYLQASIYGDQDPEFIHLLLQMLLERQRYQEAAQVAIRLKSRQAALTPEIASDMARVSITWDDFGLALQNAQRVHYPDSQDYRDHLWYGQLMRNLVRRAQQEGRQDKLAEVAKSAEDAFRTACRLAPSAPECRVALVDLLVATDHMKEARIAADDAKEMIPVEVCALGDGLYL